MQHTAKPVALVTGAARRIGKAIALDLAANGFGVVVHASRSRSEAEEVVALIRDHGGVAEPCFADLRDRAAVRAMVPGIVAKTGGLQIVVNNASVFRPDEATALDDTLWDEHFAVHVAAPALLAEGLATHLAKTGQNGLIVNMIDQRVWRLTPRFFSYTLSKSTLWTATQTLAQALAPAIRVNAIGPGPTLANERQAPEDFAAQLAHVPLKVGPELSAFGETVRYFWNNPSITGQMIALDGGQHLAWETPDVLLANE